MLSYRQSQPVSARRRIPFVITEIDGVTMKTGVTISAGDLKLSKNGAAEANHAGTMTEVAGGLYYYEATAGELDTLGFLTLRWTRTDYRMNPVSVTVDFGDDFVDFTVGASSSTTEVRTDLTQANDFWNKGFIVFTTGTYRGVSRYVEDFANTNGAFTVAALPGAPSSGDKGLVIGYSP